MTQSAKARPVGEYVTASLKEQLAKLPHSKERSSEMFRGFGGQSKASKTGKSGSTTEKSDHRRK